jgi:hypothetical protein
MRGFPSASLPTSLKMSLMHPSIGTLTPLKHHMDSTCWHDVESSPWNSNYPWDKSWTNSDYLEMNHRWFLDKQGNGTHTNKAESAQNFTRKYIFFWHVFITSYMHNSTTQMCQIADCYTAKLSCARGHLTAFLTSCWWSLHNNTPET